MAYSLLTSGGCLHPPSSRRINPVPGRLRTPRSQAPTRVRALMTVAFMAVAAPVGCFTHPINRAPVVLSIDPVASFVRGGDASFTARTSDPDSDAVVVSWAVVAGVCPPDPGDPARWPVGSPSSTFPVPGTLTKDPFCVWAFATDSYGAMGVRTTTGTPADQPPVAEIMLDSPDLQATYPLYTHFRLSGAKSKDPDLLDLITDFGWSMQAPSGADAHLGPCDDAADPSVRCFDANRPGRYAPSLMVTSGDRVSAPASPPLYLDVQDDTPPCIRNTTPNYQTSFVSIDPNDQKDPNRTFTVVRIDDDGDPYPNAKGGIQNLTVTWFLSKPGAAAGTPLEVQDTTLWSLTIPPGTYRSGDETTVRLEAHDRNVEAVDAILRSCPYDEPLCGKTPGCFQRVTWTVRWQ